MMRWLAILFGVLMIIGGAYCIASPGMTFLTLGLVVGIVMALDGIALIVEWFRIRQYASISGWVLVGAIVSLVFGVVVIGSSQMQLAVDLFIYYALAIWLIVMGILRIVFAFRLRGARNEINSALEGVVEIDVKWWLALILGLLLIACGVYGFFAPGVFMEAIGIFVGLSIIVAGVSLISFATLMRPF